MPEQKPDFQETGRYYALAQVGLEMVAPLALGALIDHWLGSQPWGVVVGAVLGFVGGPIHLILLVQRMDREEAQRKKKNGA